MRPTRDEWAMALVSETAKRATCLRRQVGCVLLNARGHVLATGYNGVASGMPHCNESQADNFEEQYFSSGDYEMMSIWRERKCHPHACPGAQSPSGTNLDGCEAIHAEQNALLQCRDVYEIHSCYVSCSPCMTCIKLLLNTSCQKIYFNELYSNSDPLNLWLKSGRQWVQIKEN